MSCTVLQHRPRSYHIDFPINEENIDMVLAYLGETEESMLSTFYEDNIKNKLTINDKTSFIKQYIKDYLVLLSNCIN